MLPKINQLKKKADFEKVFKKGKNCKENFLYLKMAKNGLEESRFGFVVSKKFSPKATARNKMKRRLRELTKIFLPRLKKGFDVIVVVVPGFEISDFWEIEAILKKLFEKSGLLVIK